MDRWPLYRGVIKLRLNSELHVSLTQMVLSVYVDISATNIDSHKMNLIAKSTGFLSYIHLIIVHCFLKFQIAVLDLIYRGKVISVEGESLTVQLTSTVRSVGCFSLLSTFTHTN